MLLLLAFLVGSFIGCAKQPYIEQEISYNQNEDIRTYKTVTYDGNGFAFVNTHTDTIHQASVYIVKTTIWRDKKEHDYIYCNQTAYLPADSVLFYKALECDKARVILDNLTKFNSEGGCE